MKVIYALKNDPKLRGRSLQANYTDWANAACRQSRQPLWVEDVACCAMNLHGC
jgi:hypothetical protein